MKKYYRLLAGIGFILLLGFTFRPIHNIELSQCAKISGPVTKVSAGSAGDIVFSLHNEDLTFYINRGAEIGFDLGAMQDTLLGKDVTIWYVKNYSLMNMVAPTKHISQMNIGNKQVFSELVPH